jgi:hypothetical protein
MMMRPGALRSAARALSAGPPAVRGPGLLRRLAAVDGLQLEFSRLEDAHLDKMRELERELRERSTVIFARRQAIVSGADEPTDDEVAASRDISLQMMEDDTAELSAARGIPGFWKGVLLGVGLTTPDGEPAVTERDAAVLETLEEIRIERWTPEDEDGPIFIGEESEDDEDRRVQTEDGFALIFAFGPNEFLDSNGPAEMASSIIVGVA